MFFPPVHFILMAFLMTHILYGCLEEEGLGKSPEKWAAKYKLSTGGEIAMTYDNSKELFRNDNWVNGMHIINITDKKNQVIHMYYPATGWTDYPYSSSSDSSGSYIFNEADAGNLEKLPNRTIAGKVCLAYKYTHKNGTEFITATWKGIMMYNEDVKTGVTMEATSVTLDFPASAFSQESIEVTWL
jgi:hypothetical protein